MKKKEREPLTKYEKRRYTARSFAGKDFVPRDVDAGTAYKDYLREKYGSSASKDKG